MEGIVACRLPYVDYPECKTQYVETNASLDWVTSILLVMYVCLDIYAWRILLKLTRDGLPRNTDAVSFVGFAVLTICSLTILVSPMGLRYGSWFHVFSMVGEVGQGAGAAATVIMVCASVRNLVGGLHGRMHLPRCEYWFYVIHAVLMVSLGLPVVALLILGRVTDVPLAALQITDIILYSVDTIDATFCIFVLTVYLWSFRRDAQTLPLLMPFVYLLPVGWAGVSCSFLRLFFTHPARWEGLVGDAPLKDQVMLNFAITLLLLFVLSIWVAATLCVVVLSKRLGFQWSSFPGRLKSGENANDWWLDAKEMVLSTLLPLYFGLGIYVPVMLPGDMMKPYSSVLLFLVCGIFTWWVEKSNRLSPSELRNASVSADTRPKKSVLHDVQYVQDAVFDCLLFTTAAFSPVSQWSTQFGNATATFSFMDFVDTSVFQATASTRSNILGALLFIYYAWLLVPFMMRLFPVSARWERVYLSVSAILYVPCAGTAVRLFLRATQCDAQNLLVWDETECDTMGRHRSIVVFCTSGTIWCVCLASLQFAAVGKFSLPHARLQNPAVSVRNCFFRFCMAFSSIYLTGILRLVVDILIVVCATAQQFAQPLFIGRARPNAFRAGALLAAMTINVIGVLNFVLLDSVVPIILSVVLFPTAFVVGYLVAYRGSQRLETEVRDIACTAAALDYAGDNLPVTALACSAHSLKFQTFLRHNLFEHAQDTILTSCALNHLAAAVSLDVGVRAIVEDAQVLTWIPQWLLSSEHRAEAINCVHALAKIDALHLKIREHMMSELLTVWRLVDGNDHVLCSEVIAKIRGNHKIIVTMGRVSECREITIPARTVWLVPHSPNFSHFDPINCLLSSPPLHELPTSGSVLLLAVPHMVIPTSQSWVDSLQASRKPIEKQNSILSRLASSVGWQDPVSSARIACANSSASPQPTGSNLDTLMTRCTVMKSQISMGISPTLTWSQRIARFLPRFLRTEKKHEVAPSVMVGKRVPRVLFVLPEEIDLCEDEDAVLRLRQQLTTFFAFGLESEAADLWGSTSMSTVEELS